jgi:hypothetical protein
MKKLIVTCPLFFFIITANAQHYNNFKVSVYCRAYEVIQMSDTTNYLKPKWDEISRQLKVDKVYLETHRDLKIVDQKTLDMRVAGYTFEKVDKFLGKVGNPIGIKSYRPYNAVGEDFLQNYLGMGKPKRTSLIVKS